MKSTGYLTDDFKGRIYYLARFFSIYSRNISSFRSDNKYIGIAVSDISFLNGIS
jgi:hypothetical protein